MNEDFYVAVIIPTFNCTNEIRSTIESVLDQTQYSKQIKIILIDNCSTDGTYEEILGIAKENIQQISVFRLNETMKWPRVYKKLAELLRYTPISYSTVLKPGDVLYPNAIETCVKMFREVNDFEGRILISEVDLADEHGDKKHQKPIFDKNCVLKSKIHDYKFLTTGIGHKIQTFFKGMPVLVGHPLIKIVDFINYNDWFYKYFYNFGDSKYIGDSIYIKDSLGCIKKEKHIDPVEDLVNRLLVLRKREYLCSLNIQCYVGNELGSKYQLSYKYLAILALKYAIEQISIDNNYNALDCLKFAELIDSNIVEESMYIDIYNALSNKASIERLKKYEEDIESTNLK